MQLDLEEHQISWWDTGFGPYSTGEQRMAHWWEHLPPTNVVQVQILVSMPYVSWGCCWFSSFLWEVFLQVLWFSPLLKDQHFHMCYLQTIFIYLVIYLFTREARLTKILTWIRTLYSNRSSGWGVVMTPPPPSPVPCTPSTGTYQNWSLL